VIDPFMSSERLAVGLLLPPHAMSVMAGRITSPKMAPSRPLNAFIQFLP
jgi:hypothetical protein